MRRFIATALIVCLAGLLCAQADAAVFSANFDSGFSDSQKIDEPAGSQWFQAHGPGHYADVAAYDRPTLATSGSFVIGNLGGEGLASHPTGAELADTDVVAQISMISGADGHALFGLSPSQDSGAGGDRWRAIPGGFIMLWTPSFGVETYGTGYNAYPGVLTGLEAGAVVDFRLSTETASGAQTGLVEYSTDGGSNFTAVGTVTLSGDYQTTYVVLGLAGSNLADDVSFSSVPEPASVVLLAAGVLVALRRRSR